MSKIYNAPKPTYSNWEWFKYVTLRTLFPPILLWDLLKTGVNKLVGEKIGGLILPAQDDNFSDLVIDDATIHQYDESDCTCEKIDVVTYDRAHLDTFEIKHKSQEKIASMYQKYIINFVGNGMCYEHIVDEMKQDAQALQCTIVGFNFRGVGQSSSRARSKNELVIDGIAQVQRLIDQGVSPQNITLKAHSLGAGIASLVAQHFHRLGQPINVFNSRSFSSITNVLVGHIRLDSDKYGMALGHRENQMGVIWGWLAKPFIKILVVLAKWEINAGDAFKDIPEAYRDYIVVRSRKNIRGDRIDDAVIPHYASIHKVLTAERQAKKAAIDQLIAEIGDIDTPSHKSHLIQTKKDLIEAREKIKSDRKMETDKKSANGHVQEWQALHNCSGKSAQTFFREFVQRAYDDHAVKEENIMNKNL